MWQYLELSKNFHLTQDLVVMKSSFQCAALPEQCQLPVKTTTNSITVTPVWQHHLLPPKMAGIVENSTGGVKKIMFIHYYIKLWSLYSWRSMGSKLSVWSGSDDKSLFHIMHWADIINKEAQKCSTDLKNSFTCYIDKKLEHWIFPEKWHHRSNIKSSNCKFFREAYWWKRSSNVQISVG